MTHIFSKTPASDVGVSISIKKNTRIMKYSIFNSVIVVECRHTLIYNSFSGRFVAIKNNILNLNNISIDEIKLNHPQLHQQLQKGGMIIENCVDETSMLKDRINNADNNKHEFILHINPTLDCNFNCWYCYENHITHSKMNESVIESTLRLISNILKNPDIKLLELGFFGGEPLMYFDSIARRIIEYSNSLCSLYHKEMRVHFTSNGSLLNERIVSFLSKFPCGFQITLDGGKKQHDETRYYHNGKGSYETIVKNILKLCSAKIAVIIRINYTQLNIDSVNSILDSFKTIPQEKRNLLRFDFQRVWQDSKRRTDETELKASKIRDNFRKEGYTVLTNYIPHNVNDSCYGDKTNHVLINYNGMAFGCTARDFTQENSIGVLDASGIIQYDTEKTKRRNQSKYSKPICRRCRIAPICGGGCKQRAMESMNSDGCTLGYSESDKDDIILDIFEYLYGLKAEKQ